MIELLSIKVQNFRALKEGFVDFERTTIIIGENGAGISILLEAIHLALDPSLKEALPEFNKYHFHVSKSNKDKDKKLALNLRILLQDKFRTSPGFCVQGTREF